MNTDKILALADHIQGLGPDQFRMSDCRRCIMGQALILWGQPENSMANSAASHLNIDERQADHLFFPTNGPGSEDFAQATGGRYPIFATAAEAATVLRHLAKHKVVDWSAAVWHDA